MKKIRYCDRDDYKELVEDVRKSYKDGKNNLEWCYDGAEVKCCSEINLWTYWQGRNNTKTKILVVGQDWGSKKPTHRLSKDILENVKLVQTGQYMQYLPDENKQCTTDKNLVRLFKVMGNIDVEKPCDDIFFTNFVLGYRKENYTGSIKRACFEADRKYFKRLVKILQPQIIICLGKVVYEEVLSTFYSKKIRSSSEIFWGNLNKNCENHETIISEAGNKIEIFGVAHPGYRGAMNRKRLCKDDTGKTGVELMEYDWENIGKYI